MDKRTLLFMLCVSLSFFAIHFFFAPNLPQEIKQAPPKQIAQYTPPITSSDQGSYYVLENEYQQLVFTDRGGSLVEINLPLVGTSPKSYVKEIDFDREILKSSPENSYFPLHSYLSADGERHEKGALGGYYPLLRRGINGRTLPSEYNALNIISENLNDANAIFRMSRFEKNLIEFQGSVSGVQITKTYTIPSTRNGPYCFNLDIRVDGDPKGLWLTSGVPDVEIVSNSYSPLLRIQVTKNKSSDVETIDLPKKDPMISMTSPNWISNCNGFLGMIMDPLDLIGAGYKTVQIPGDSLPTRLTLIDSSYHRYLAKDYPGYATYLPLKAGVSSFRIFAGPYDNSLLKELDALYEEPLKNYNPDYTAALSIQGWFSFISQPFSKFLFFLMQIFYTITRSWAAAIILLTIALRAMMYPLNNWSIRSSIKMQEIAPKVKAVQEKYKKDPKKAQMEVMNLYRQSGINPLIGCFPVLLQMPFLVGMFYLLKSSFPLRGAVFIPGWIDDLSAPDVLFSWGQPIWFIGNELHLLPILMGLTMYLQQRFTSKLPKDSSKLSDAQKQQKLMGNMMAVLFTVMFYNFPSGLNIYFMFSTLLGIAQQVWIQNKMKAEPKKA